MITYKDWIYKAKDDYSFATVNNEASLYFDNYCYFAQQAVEKALKGLLVYFGVEPEHTHSISRLLNELVKHTSLDEKVYKYATLSVYAVQSRYPDEYLEISEQDFNEAIQIAKDCLDWVDEKIASEEKKRGK